MIFEVDHRWSQGGTKWRDKLLFEWREKSFSFIKNLATADDEIE